MPVNKVIYGVTTLIDITDSTVTADKLATGITAYDKSGTKITGTMSASSGLDIYHGPSAPASNIGNNNDIALVQPDSETATLYPSSEGETDNATWADSSNAFDAETSEDSATLTYERLASTTMYGVLNVDISSIPANSEVTSITFTTRGKIYSSYGKGEKGSWMDCGCALIVNGTEVARDGYTLKNTERTLTGTVENVGTLQTLALRYFYESNTYGAQDIAGVMTIYGATITIVYKNNDKSYATLYVKKNGSWQLVSDIATDIPTAKGV